jgi:hypothetical protein
MYGSIASDLQRCVKGPTPSQCPYTKIRNLRRVNTVMTNGEALPATGFKYELKDSVEKTTYFVL